MPVDCGRLILRRLLIFVNSFSYRVVPSGWLREEGDAPTMGACPRCAETDWGRLYRLRNRPFDRPQLLEAAKRLELDAERAREP